MTETKQLIDEIRELSSRILNIQFPLFMIVSMYITATAIEKMHPHNILGYVAEICVIGFLVYLCYSVYRKFSTIHKTLNDKLVELEAKLTKQNQQSEQLIDSKSID